VSNPELLIQGLAAGAVLLALVALGLTAISFLRPAAAPPSAPPSHVQAEPVPAPAPEREPVAERATAEPATAEPAIPEPAKEEAPPAPNLATSLGQTRKTFFGRLDSLLRGRPSLDADTVAEIETLLFGADLGVRTADDLLETARAAGSPEAVRAALEARASEILLAVASPAPPEVSGPRVILVVGVNGAGKTTAIGKLAARHVRAGERVLVAAGDTYRAAAIEQLEIWAERAGAEIVKGEPGGDPAAVAFDAVSAARSRDADLVIIDTAGRLQTDRDLMDELAKISRVVKKEIPDAPHEVLLVLDANTGQNAIRQAQEFTASVDVTGIVLTKLDGTAKGGVVLGVAQEVGVPVRYVGVGEGVADLADFDANEFARALFSESGATG